MPKTYTTVPTVNPGDAILASSYNTYQKDNVNNLIVPPMCRVFLSSTWSVTNNAHNLVNHSSGNSTENIDTDGMLTLSAVASNMTVQTAGVYLLTATADFAANATGVRFARIIRQRSGVNTMVAHATVASVGAANSTSLSVAGMIECNANDLIILGVWQNSGGALNLQATTEFAGTMLAATWIGRTS